MSTMNISLPETLKSYVDERVATGGYGTSSEYVRELIRHDQQVHRFRKLIEEGLQSPVAGPVDDALFADLKAEARRLAQT